jgi:hypothetical protein
MCALQALGGGVVPAAESARLVAAAAREPEAVED